MKYQIYKLSDLGQSKPCEGAYKEGFVWLVELETLQDLQDLQSSVGFPIQMRCSNILTIYDDYD